MSNHGERGTAAHGRGEAEGPGGGEAAEHNGGRGLRRPLAHGAEVRAGVSGEGPGSVRGPGGSEGVREPDPPAGRSTWERVESPAIGLARSFHLGQPQPKEEEMFTLTRIPARRLGSRGQVRTTAHRLACAGLGRWQGAVSAGP